MPLVKTNTFVEARETGKTSLKIPSVGLSSGQVNRVQEQISVQDICTYCGKRGHGKQPSLMKLMKKQQNMMKLRHQEWCDNFQTYIKASLRKDPTMKIRMCLDILSYKKHDPPLDYQVQQKWIDSLENRQQKDILLKTSTADTGAQCFLLGRDHLPGLGRGWRTCCVRRSTSTPPPLATWECSLLNSEENTM